MVQASLASNLSIGTLPSTGITSKGKFAIWASTLSILFLSQIAVNLGEFPVSVDFICYAMFTLYLLLSGYASLSIFTLVLYLVAAVFAGLTMVLTASLASWTSFLLLFALYAPFLFRLKARPDLDSVQQYIQSVYIFAATIIGCIAVMQIVLVNMFGASYLTNIYFVLPEEIRGAGTYTFLREEGGIVKANGFFLRESAILSMVTSLALIIEYSTRARWHIVAILAAGLLCSFSGSGAFALAFGLLMPRSLNRVPVFLVSLLAFIFAFFILYNAEIPGLTLWFDRLSEFQIPGSSGYARYVAPLDMIQRSFNEGGARIWLGNGAGSYLRSIGLLRARYEISDPTWAKLIYEYGLLGLGLISVIFSVRVYSSALRAEARNYILFVWISIGLLLNPDFVFNIWLLTLVPMTNARSIQNKRY